MATNPEVLLENKIKDMLNTTLYKLNKGKFQMLATDSQEYKFFAQLRSRKGIKVKRGGLGIQETLMVDDGGESQWVGLHQEDTYKVGDFLDKMQIGWAHLTDNMLYERRELLENRGEERVNNVLVPRRTAMMIRIAKTLEKAYWGVPPTDDKLQQLIMWGVLYWICPNYSDPVNNTGDTTGDTFDGSDTIANVNLSEVGSKFKNYYDAYSTVSVDDLLKRMRKGHRKTHWVAPVTKKEFRKETGQRRKIFVNEETISAMEDILYSQNDNLGHDLASMDGQTTFKGHAVEYVPALDQYQSGTEGKSMSTNSDYDVRNPVFMLDLDTFYPVVLAGDYLRQSPAEKVPGQHNSFKVDVDLSINSLCVDRRSNALFAQASAA